jgi:hypothetical protein
MPEEESEALRREFPQPSIGRRDFLRRLACVGAAAAVASNAALNGGCASSRVGSAFPSTYDPDMPSIPGPRWDPAASAQLQAGVTVAQSPTSTAALFDSFFLGGFECSTHYRRDLTRLDIVASTRHDEFALLDYERLKAMGMLACRDGARWHLIEREPKTYRFDSLIPLARAAEMAGMTVIWDLMHYGWPGHLNIYSSRFPTAFARYAAAAAKVLDEFTPPGRPLWISPVNEISFMAWAGGDASFLAPYDYGRGHLLKRQLAVSAMEAIDRIREVVPRARFMHCDPAINVVGRPWRFGEQRAAEAYRMAQYQAFDILIGDVYPELGGRRDYLDVIGLNYYRNNQTYFHSGEHLQGDDPQYRHLADMLKECWKRYQRPLIIAETGAEAGDRVHWLKYVAGEAGIAMRDGVPLQGLTWYPILNHPGWEDDRHVHNGLWDYADDTGERELFKPLAVEIRRQTPALTALRERALATTGTAGTAGTASAA